jgi:hypothetical protein
MSRLPQSGQARGTRSVKAAVVAAQRAVDLVEHAEGAAVRALAFPAAVGAVQHRRVAAPVQEHHGLLAARHPLAMASSSGAEQSRVPLGWLMVHVDPRTRGSRQHRRCAARHRQALVAAGAVLGAGVLACQLSSDGVAEPRITLAPDSLPRYTARSRAE